MRRAGHDQIEESKDAEKILFLTPLGKASSTR